MILSRNCIWYCLLISLAIWIPSSLTQHSRNYDTSDWIPMTPASSIDGVAKRATGRVLNVESPSIQNYFTTTGDKYGRKRPSTYILEPPSIPLRSFYEHPYKFEAIPVQSLVPQQHHHHHQQPFYLQTPPSQDLTVPPIRPQVQALYRANTTATIPQYKPIHPNAINREILAAINLNVPPAIQHPEENKDTVQLLYVPLENLPQHQPPPILTNKAVNFVSVKQSPDNYVQQQIPQNIFASSTTSTTVVPPVTKLKPHQPPLAVYMESPSKADVTKVLHTLKNAKSITVLDKVGPNTPQIFVGPSNLTPSGYTKFPLPYLSSFAGRFERKVDQIPFFVAPLSYKTPDGYSKIPLPSPHIGSVVISNKDKTPQPNALPQYKIPSVPSVPPQLTNLPFYNPFVGVLPVYNNFQDQPPPPPQFVPPMISKPQNHYFDGRFENYLIPPQRIPEHTPISNPYKVQKPVVHQQQPHHQAFIQTTVSSNDILKTKPAITTPTPHNMYRPTNLDVLLTSPIPPTRHKPFKTTSYSSFVFPSGEDQPIQFDPRKPAINQLELQQINEFVQAIASDNQTRIDDIIKVPTTAQPQRSPVHPTLPTTDEEKYTILEEFVVNPNHKPSTPPSPPPPPKYNTEVETIPAKVYKINSNEANKPQPGPTYAPIYSSTPKPPGILGVLDEEILRNRPPLYTIPPNIHYINYQQFNEHDTIPDLVNGLQDQIGASLQDQQVRSLLSSHLLVPNNEKPISSTEYVIKKLVVPTGHTYAPETTPIPGSTGVHQHAQINTINDVRYITTTTTAPTRRTVNRRRPTVPSISSFETGDESDKGTTRPRFRARIRPTAPSTSDASVTERVSHESIDDNVEPTADVNIELSRENVHTTNQFDTSVTNRESATTKSNTNDVNKDKENQVYSVSLPFYTDVTKITPRPVVTHSSTDGVRDPITVTKAPTVVTRPHYRRTTSTTETPKKARTRTRGKSRYGTSQKPTTTTVRSITIKKNDENEDVYKFIRRPEYNQVTTTLSSSYQAPTYTTQKPIIHQLLNDEGTTTPIRFLGEIRPKYTITTTPATGETEPPLTVRTRGRTRVSVTTIKPTGDVTNQVRRIQTLNRSKNHFKTPENSDNDGENGSVESGDNYPAHFLRQRAEQTTTKRPTFTITVPPENHDQLPYSSIYRSNILADSPAGWVEATADPPTNQIDVDERDDKPETVTTIPSSIPSNTEKFYDITTEASATTKKKSRRRGVWKLVRQRPVDNIEVAESQNYDTVFNNYNHESTKISSKDEVKTKDGGLLDTFYSLFKNAQSEDVTTEKAFDEDEEESNFDTTSNTPVSYPDEYTEDVESTTATMIVTPVSKRLENSTSIVFPTTTIPPPALPTTTTEAIDNEAFLKEMEALWGMPTVKTSTSTEISHETEICYKGKCVKSQKSYH